MTVPTNCQTLIDALPALESAKDDAYDDMSEAFEALILPQSQYNTAIENTATVRSKLADISFDLTNKYNFDLLFLFGMPTSTIDLTDQWINTKEDLDTALVDEESFRAVYQTAIEAYNNTVTAYNAANDALIAGQVAAQTCLEDDIGVS